MTEQTGQNSELLPDLPGAQPAVDPQAEIAPRVTPHDVSSPDPGQRAVATVEAGAADAAPSVSPDSQPDLAVIVAEEAAPESDAETASPDSVVRVKSAEPPRRRAESGKSRKAAAVAAAPAGVPDIPKSENMNWYILKVQSNREESIREGLLRRVSIQGLDRYFSEVIVPTEKVTEFKAGKKRVIKRKLYPGYIVVHMEINEDTWFLVRETPGIGDFTGASGVPTPMLPHEVERILAKQEEKSEKAPDLKIPFTKGDRVKVVEGNFENFEGEVDAIDKTNGRVTVMITIFNRTTPVEFEYWQVESV